MVDSQATESTGAAFARAFGGGGEALAQLPDLEEDRINVLRPMLEKEYALVPCTAITRHMWAHAEHMNFKTKYEMYAWIRSQWEVTIVSKSNVISNMKTANTRNCTLCMQERIKGYFTLSMRETQNPN